MTRTLWGIANDEQLAALTTLLDDYVRDMGFVSDTVARDHVAGLIMALFNEGVQPEEIRRRLNSSPRDSI